MTCGRRWREGAGRGQDGGDCPRWGIAAEPAASLPRPTPRRLGPVGALPERADSPGHCDTNTGLPGVVSRCFAQNSAIRAYASRSFSSGFVNTTRK